STYRRRPPPTLSLWFRNRPGGPTSVLARGGCHAQQWLDTVPSDLPRLSPPCRASVKIFPARRKTDLGRTAPSGPAHDFSRHVQARRGSSRCVDRNSHCRIRGTGEPPPQPFEALEGRHPWRVERRVPPWRLRQFSVLPPDPECWLFSNATWTPAFLAVGRSSAREQTLRH